MPPSSMRATYRVNDVIFATQSRGRKALFHQYFPEGGYVIHASDLDEKAFQAMPLPAARIAVLLAREKANTVAREFPKRWVMGFDTVLEVSGQLLGKPKDFADARMQLRLLSGETHRVISAACLSRWEDDVDTSFSVWDESYLRCATVDEAWIDAYLQTHGDLVLSVAGSYAMQDSSTERFVTLERGAQDTVIGAPVEKMLKLLQMNGLLDA